MKVYTFGELDNDAKEKARSWYRESAVDPDWWMDIYEDAGAICMDITSFNDHSLEASFTGSARATALQCVSDHGTATATYRDSAKFLRDHAAKQNAMEAACTALGENGDTSWKAETANLENDFLDWEQEAGKKYLHAMCENYRIMLREGMDYVSSDEQVDEFIMANEYEFDKAGGWL